LYHSITHHKGFFLRKNYTNVFYMLTKAKENILIWKSYPKLCVRLYKCQA
jgi:hypothetical protein